MRLFACLTAAFLAATCAADSLPLRVEFQEELDSQLANIHVYNAHHVPGVVAFTYGSCASTSRQGSHHEIASAEVETGEVRLVWVIPADVPSHGCVSAWNGSGELVGRSRAQNLHAVKRQIVRRAAVKPIAMNQSNGFDPLGAWFDGIKFVSQREPGVVDVRAAKAKEIAIVGAGISGLMTYLILQQAGLTNLSIIESDTRIGGRIHTQYLTGGPSNYSYQELGVMRVPLDYTDPESGNSMNISDFQLVYALIDEMNRLNAKDDPALRIDLIPWLEDSDNGLKYFGEFRMPGGLPPTARQARLNSSLVRPEVLDGETAALRRKLNESLPGRGFMARMASSMYKAHREWIDGGLGDKQKGDRWSEFAFLSQHLRGSLNSSDILSELDNPAGSFWTYVTNYFYENADNWRTVDGGFSRLAESFWPLVRDDLRLNATVERIDYEDRRLTLQWRSHWKDATAREASFDYAVITVPFSVVRQWRLPGLATTMNNALQNLVYDTSCKVALEYSERFWERLANPIYGSCSTETDIPGVGLVCYPSYNINSTGPAAILGSYVEGTVNHDMSRMLTMSDEEHAHYILNAMTEIHGEHTRRLYTGKFARKCWSLDPRSAGAWASPTVGQHELYMPEYFKVHRNMIFVGEHTSFTHGWVPSALDSAIRGAVQLLLELGLVDEAKAVVRKWMAGWIRL
ncbi:hypothetical protein E4U41_003823 [Claviceps citrina]|nr:hypothetical protein E4U41_003823 [Claviceps citrina]